MLVCLPSGSTDVAASPSQYMIQPSGIPILSPVLFMHVGDPYIQIRRIFDLLVSPPFLGSSYISNYYPKPALLSLLHTYCSITMRFVTKKMKSTKVQTLGANIWPGVDALKSCRACGRLLESARVNEHVMESIRKQKTLYKLYG